MSKAEDDYNRFMQDIKILPEVRGYVQELKEELEREIICRKTLEDDKKIHLTLIGTLTKRILIAEDQNEKLLDLLLEWWCIDDLDWVQSKIENIMEKPIKEIIEIIMRNK